MNKKEDILLLNKDKTIYTRREMLQLWYKQIKRQESNNPINIYNIERTLCDIIRHYKSMDREIVNKTIIRKYCTENQKREVVCPYDMCKKNRDC